MLEFDLARSFPSIAIGFVVGVLVFAPLLAAVLPVLRRTRDADMTLGFIGIFASFTVLLVGVLAAYVLARSALVPFAVGELVGFFLGMLGLSLLAILKGNG